MAFTTTIAAALLLNVFAATAVEAAPVVVTLQRTSGLFNEDPPGAPAPLARTQWDAGDVFLNGVTVAEYPRPLIYVAARREWQFLGSLDQSVSSGPRNLPLGILGIADYDTSDLELQLGDCVVAYTDALIECQDADGEMLGEDGVLRILRLMGDADPPTLIKTLLAELADRYPENLGRRPDGAGRAGVVPGDPLLPWRQAPGTGAR